jgi:beta-1,2-mannobiose phosphorylase / 1,2-beta-oligomannan phosphorylase
LSGFQLQRLGTVMEPEPGNLLEVEGVLNPAAARGPDGQLYLFPRLVARGNYSRIGIARVRFDTDGDPVGVERLGVVLEPDADYERRPDGGGGCEDPRVTYMEPLGCYLMTYTAFSPRGPRIALAMSEDLFHWQRLGLAAFTKFHGIDFGGVDDKDASLFPVTVPGPLGVPELAMLHRPLFPGTRPEETARHPTPRVVDINQESIWISYCPTASALHGTTPVQGGSPPGRELGRPGRFAAHHRLATPVSPWERLKIGGGTPPILTRHGWLIIYHGVSNLNDPTDGQHHMCYSAGAMVISREHPLVIRYRSAEPILTPELPQERIGTVASVVFPTGIDRRDDLGLPNRFDVYYGMADDRIGVARLDLPDSLPTRATADPSAVNV